MKETYGDILRRPFDIPFEDLRGEYIVERNKIINDFCEANRDDLLKALAGWAEDFGPRVPLIMLKDFNINPLFTLMTGMLYGYLLKEKEIRSKP